MPTALITGASTGIGREFAHLCARDGYDLILTARSRGRLDALGDEIRQKTGRTGHVFARDLGDPAESERLYADTTGAGLNVDVLINNAGFGLVGRFWELDAREQVEMITLNVTAVTALARLYLPGMIARRSGGIVNVASTAAFQPGPLMAVYYATKAYVVSFSEALYNEAREYGVTVSCLCPGPTRTEFDKRAGASATKLFSSGRAMSAAIVAQVGWAGFKRGKHLVVAGRLNGVMAFLTRFAPVQFTASMARKFQESH
jgi:short-subunit dehydrogenase